MSNAKVGVITRPSSPTETGTPRWGFGPIKCDPPLLAFGLQQTFDRVGFGPPRTPRDRQR
jgi:hypothetical protein